MLGLCHTLRFLRPVPAITLEASLELRPNASVSFALHEDGEELWLSEGVMPNKIDLHRFDAEVP